MLPRLDGEGSLEYALEFNGLPNQCGRCRSHEHQVRHCPKNDLYGRKKEHRLKNIHTQAQVQEPTSPEHRVPPEKQEDDPQPTINPGPSTTAEPPNAEAQKSPPTEFEQLVDLANSELPHHEMEPTKGDSRDILAEKNVQAHSPPPQDSDEATQGQPDHPTPDKQHPFMQHQAWIAKEVVGEDRILIDGIQFPKLPTSESRGPGSRMEEGCRSPDLVASTQFVYWPKPPQLDSPYQETSKGKK